MSSTLPASQMPKICGKVTSIDWLIETRDLDVGGIRQRMKTNALTRVVTILRKRRLVVDGVDVIDGGDLLHQEQLPPGCFEGRKTLVVVVDLMSCQSLRLLPFRSFQSTKTVLLVDWNSLQICVRWLA